MSKIQILAVAVVVALLPLTAAAQKAAKEKSLYDIHINHFFAATASNPPQLASFKMKLVEDLVGALDKFKVGKAEKDQLLGVLGPMQGAIVEKR
jgi:hypothetical protein